MYLSPLYYSQLSLAVVHLLIYLFLTWGFHYAAQTDLELPGSNDLPASAAQVTETTDPHHLPQSIVCLFV